MYLTSVGAGGQGHLWGAVDLTGIRLLYAEKVRKKKFRLRDLVGHLK